jgi:hypothetical protein
LLNGGFGEPTVLGLKMAAVVKLKSPEVTLLLASSA